MDKRRKKLFFWGHLKNFQTELWTCQNGIKFSHACVSIKAANIGTRNATYSRIYKYPIKLYDSQYIMVYSDFDKAEGTRSVWLAHSKNARNWTQPKTPLVGAVMRGANDLYGPSPLLWKERNYQPPTVAGNFLYALREDGLILFADISKGFKFLGMNDMGERVIASPVPINGKILIRGKRI